MDYLTRDDAVSVSDLNQYISLLMERDEILSWVRVRGEVSNFKRHASGHLYFSMKDAGGTIRCVMFRGDAIKSKIELHDGDRIVATGSIGNYAPQGQYQLYVKAVEADGVGALYAAFEALKEKLSKEGLFDETHKKSIPVYPKTIGIVTSPTGAAIRDILQILDRRYPLAKVVLYPASVQGIEAHRTLKKGIEYFQIHKPDVIIIGRGGGSKEDLWCFNDEELARAIFASEVPVVSAVGHEIDFSISDFVADLRAPTPSAAAELVTPDIQDLYLQLDKMVSRAKNALSKYVQMKRNAVSFYGEDRIVKIARRQLREEYAKLSHLEESLYRNVESYLMKKRGDLSLLSEKLQALSPLSILSRGYAALTDKNGVHIDSVKQIQIGDALRARVSDGYIMTVIQDTEEVIHGTDL